MWSRTTLILIGIALFSQNVFAQPKPTTKPALSQAVMVGSYSVTGSDKPPAQDRYTLGSVTKKEGETWIFVSTIQFGGRNISLPLEVPVKWAGDTPVISVTDVGVPGLGTYTARVVVYGDQYAGIWSTSDGSHGGQMWGKLEHPTTKPAK
jgi:hypothetical protein